MRSADITAVHVERGISIAQREGDLRWDWADLALEVAPPASGKGDRNGGFEALRDLLDQISANGDVSISELPTIDSLRHYRDGAAAMEGIDREGVSVYVARELGRNEPSSKKRAKIVAKLRKAHPRGRVTVDGLRKEYGKKLTRTPGEASERVQADLEQMTPEDKAKLAMQLANDPTISPDDKAEMAAKAFSTKEARHAADNLPPDDRANIIQTKTWTSDQQDRRNDDRQALRTGNVDEAKWKSFKRHILPDFLRASAYLGQFEWTTERVAWMHEQGDRIRAAYYETAAQGARLSEEDFAALLDTGDEA